VYSIIRSSDELRKYACSATPQPIAEKEFRDGLSGLLAHVGEGTIREAKFVSVSGNSQTWIDTGIDCFGGDEITLFSTATASPSAEDGAQVDPDVELWSQITYSLEARRGVWYRVGPDSAPNRGARSSYTFDAQIDGRLFLASSLISAARTVSGAELEGEEVSAPPALDRSVLVVRWTSDALSGLTALRAGGDVGGMLDSAIESRRTVIELPSGWFSPFPGEVENFAAGLSTSKGNTIACFAHENAALLVKDALVPFGADTRLSWAWKTDQLPSTVREDALSTHDYLSIAIEFDNGRDLTYYWSAELPSETGFQCPIPGWEDRETHVVIRTGTEGLGEWLEEEREVYADYLRHIGDPPANIARVWLLAVAYLQHRAGQCEYGRIELASGGKCLRLN
jgi:hypothetical protein